MERKYFVDEQSVVRRIWGKSDTILFIFAGAAAEFALNKAVDWLYFTGKLPADPLGRLFSTVNYARAIVFSEEKAAFRAIDAMSTIHAGLEAKRGVKIPDEAYRDVLFMLIDYSIRSFEVLEHPLSVAEKEEVFGVFNRLGSRMGISDLPDCFDAWQVMRKEHLQNNLHYSHYTEDLFGQYKKHLGLARYRLLLEVQSLVVPERARALIGYRSASLLYPLLGLYKLSRSLNADWLLKALILPPAFKDQIMALDSPPVEKVHQQFKNSEMPTSASTGCPVSGRLQKILR